MKHNLREITESGDGVDIALSYATLNNFTGKSIFRSDARCFLHEVAATHLKRAVELADAIGFRIKIFDAYRPTEAQWKLWEHTPDPDFLADPAKGSPHSRGVAIDLTLLDKATNQELDMGTPFDAFTPLSYHGSLAVSKQAQINRHILLGIMSAAGWDFYSKEWWHYQLFNSREYPLLSDAEAGTAMM
jgi:D-alanyl-D-alanine dipeptidase